MGIRVSGAATMGGFVLKTAVILTLMACGIYFSNRQTVNTYLAQFSAPVGKNFNGLWVGVLTPYEHSLTPGLPVSAEERKLRHTSKKVAIGLNLTVYDAYLGFYRGTGLFFVEGDSQIQKFDHIDISDIESVIEGTVDGALTNDKSVKVYDFHKVKGVLKDGVFTINDLDFDVYGYRGELHHGDAADYFKLCQSLGLKPHPDSSPSTRESSGER